MSNIHYNQQHPGRSEPEWVTDLKPTPSLKPVGIADMRSNPLGNPMLRWELICQVIGGMGGSISLPFETRAQALQAAEYVRVHGVLPDFERDLNGQIIRQS